MNKQTIFILGIIIILALIIKAMMDKAKKNKDVQSGINTLDTNISTGQVQGTVTGAIGNSQPDISYNPVNDATSIWKSGCYCSSYMSVSGADEANIIRILKTLNSAKLARLNAYFSTAYGMDLEGFFAKYTWESERQKIFQALSMIR